MEGFRGHFKDSVLRSVSSSWFLWILTAMILIPLVATVGQFASSGFFVRSTPFLLLFWPGTVWSWAPSMPVWLTMGMMGISYVVGIWYLLRKRTLGKVVLWTIAAVIAANLVGFIVNRIAGWVELQTAASVAAPGKANAILFSLWQNPIWEEVVFRGLPLLGLMYVRKRWPSRTSLWTWMYLILPNVVFAWYHVPGHGPARIADTLILGCAFSWLALRYTLFAPVVMHYLLDAMLVVSLTKVPNIPPEEISWLVDNGAVLNTSWSLALIAAVLCVPVLTVVDLVRGKMAGSVASKE